MVHVLRSIAVRLACSCLVVAAVAVSAIAGTEPGGVAATAHPLASQAAVQMLARGGNAVDAAVAAAFAIGVVEPDGSGLGGGGGMLIYLHKTRETIYINYYQCAPGNPVASFDSDQDRDTGKSVLVPGTVAGLCRALEDYGTLPLPVVIGPALGYALDGFPVDATLGGLLLDFTEAMAERPELAEVFLVDGFPKMEGDLIKQPKLAHVLQLISEHGRDGFYKGETAQALVDGLAAQGGVMTLDDLAGYEETVSEPVRGTYRGYEIIAAPPPHSGAMLIEIMNMFELIDIDPAEHFTESAKTMHLMAEIFRRGYADRSWYIADPRFTDVPVTGLTSKAYAGEILGSINRFRAEPRNYRDTPYGYPAKFDVDRSTTKAQPAKKRPSGWGDDDDEEPGRKGRRDPFDRWNRKQHSDSTQESRSQREASLPDGSFEGASTTHLSVIDADNNMVALTQTLGNFWGSKVMVNGILLNNGRVNFSATSRNNIEEPGKRPRSSITPTMLFRDGQPAFALGSPGAGRIGAMLALVIVNIVDYGMDIQSANDAPRFFCQKFDDHLSLESRIDADVGARLSRMGHSVRFLGAMDLFFGGVQITAILPETGELVGSADPRRGGNALSVKEDAETGGDR